jgi:eukaryotic-like serine/threonine-protein kinase
MSADDFPNPLQNMADPTRTHAPAPEPRDNADRADTVDAPPPGEPVTATALTQSQVGDPLTATGPRAETSYEPLVPPPGFEIICELGSGGMGVVYEARQTQLNRRIALKVLRGGRQDAKDVIRFLTEAEAVAAVKHPHVVQVYDFGQCASGPFMVLELLTDGTLAERLEQGKLGPRAAAALVAKLADAIRAAHELGIIHRDLKPSNILFSQESAVRRQESGDGRPSSASALTPDSCLLTPKVTDFGLAKRAGGVDLTRTQAVMGTPAYMAPEQARGDTKFVGPAADIWALGAILYECMTGKRPFVADDTWAVLRKVTDEAPPAPRTHVPGLPRDLELIALKCLEKEPADRYPTAAALAADLENFLAGRPVSVHPAGTGERLLKWSRRNPTTAGLLAALAFVALVGFAGVTWGLLKAEQRGRELTRTNDDLGRTNEDLTTSRNELANANKGLIETGTALAQSQAQAKQEAENAEERGYLSDVALAHQLWKANDLAGMRDALERCPPARRKWEWYHLKSISRPERAFHITDSLPLAVAYSPNSKLLAYLTFSGALTVRDIEAEKDLYTILGKGDQTNRHAALAFHPNGNELAYIVDGRVRVVDLATGKWNELKDPKHPEGTPGNRSGSPSIAVGYTPDSQLLAAAAIPGDKPRLRSFVIRDAVTAKTISTISGYEEPEGMFTDVASAAFSMDGKHFAASAVDSGIRVGRVGEPAKQVTSFEPRAWVWDVKSGKNLREAATSSAIFGGITFDPDGESVGFGRRGWASELVIKRDEGEHYVGNHAGDVLAVAFDRNGLIWSGGEDKMILAHERKIGTQRFALRGCSRGILRLAVSPDGKEIAAGVGHLAGSGGAVYRFDVSALSADEWRNPATRDRISLVTALSPDGSRFAACDFLPFDERPNAIRFVMRDLADGKERAVTPAGLWLRSAFAPNGRLFVLEREKPNDRLERLRVIEPDGKLGHIIPLTSDQKGARHPPIVTCSPDGRTLAVVSSQTVDNTKLHAQLNTWGADTREPGVSTSADLSEMLPPKVQFPALYPLGVAIDRDSKRLAATFAANWEVEGQARFEWRGALVVWDLASGKELFRKYTADPLHAVAFDPRGMVVAAGGSAAGGAVIGWDLSTGKAELGLRGHTRPILALAFGPDNRLATAGADRVVKLWDMQSRREVLTFDGFAREVTHLAFTPDGKNLVAATGMDILNAMMTTGVPTDWPPAEVRVFRAK